MLCEIIVFLRSGVETSCCSSLYWRTDISTAALQYIDFVKQKPEYENMSNEVDRVFTPHPALRWCDHLLSSAAYLIDSMRMSADAT